MDEDGKCVISPVWSPLVKWDFLPLGKLVPSNRDPGGYRWPLTIPLVQNSYFRLAVFFWLFLESQTSGAVLRP
jgi:hypothetical protein